jgi:hypothetical protein
VQISFYVTMDRTLTICFSAVFLLVGCGDASAPRSIDPGGAHGSSTGGSADDAGATTPGHDSGSPYKDPTAGDGGCSLPNLVCNGVCIAVDSEPSNCGACGNACIGSDSVCIAGKCGCAGQGQDYCDGVGCMDVSSDFNNCGACNYMCDPNNDQACTGGVCVPNCP